MHSTIPKKCALLGSKLKLGRVIGMKMWPACASKRAKRRVIRFLSKVVFQGHTIVDDLTR
jgi:hypothetical protein